jgi:hypothetical protein
MLDAFAGPPVPIARPVRRRATARTVAIAVALVAVGGALVPASRALVHVFESPQQFVSDTTQPVRARKLIENYLARGGLISGPTLTGIEPELGANTPDGRWAVYGLKFAGGQIGAAMVALAGHNVAGLWAGISDNCPSGYVIETRGSFVEYPGHTPVYVEGLVSPAVAALDVEESNGRTYDAAIGNGYFLAWITPGPHGSKPAATLIAHSANGTRIGAVYVGAGGAIPPTEAEVQPGCG